MLITLAIVLAGASCQSPTLMPIAPTTSLAHADGAIDRLYDTTDDGMPDYAERIAPHGRIAMLRFDSDGDGTFDLDVVVDRIQREDCRELLIILDSIPERMVQDMWDQGRFRFFGPPSRVISPFPVMTDLSLSEFFGASPCPGVESAYFDGDKLTNGVDVYLHRGNAPWMDYLDYRLAIRDHGLAYLLPSWGYFTELRGIEDSFFESCGSTHVGYVVGTSALGARRGRDGHQRALINLDRFCQAVMHRTQGKVRITLLSDHGHNHITPEYFSLSKKLRGLGYRITKTLKRPGDVIVPEYSIVTCAAVYTNEPAQVAADAVGLEGIDLACYLNENDEVVVLGRRGRARIARLGESYRYSNEFGDPLQLQPTLDKLRQAGKLMQDGSASDDALFDATTDHVYPDAVHRLWRAFHGLTVNTPDVLISVKENWYCGSNAMSDLITMRAAHGSLHRISSIGFAMTSAGPLPETLRMEDLAEELRKLGLTVPRKNAAKTPRP